MRITPRRFSPPLPHYTIGKDVRRAQKTSCVLVAVVVEGGLGILRALSYYYYNGYAAVAALAGASFEIVANMTRPDPCAV